MVSGVEQAFHFVGEAAQARSGIFSLSRPYRFGIVENWDDMEVVYKHTFSELRRSPDEQPVLFSEAAGISKFNRERIIATAFDVCCVPAAYVAMQPVLSLYALGRTTGLVLDSGYDVTRAVAVYEGFAQQDCVLRADIAGRDVDDHLWGLLVKRGESFTTAAKVDLIRDIKETIGYVASNFDVELVATDNEAGKAYELPDGNTVMIGAEAFTAPEALFNPRLMEKESQGVHQLVYDCIMRSDIDTRAVLYGNIVLVIFTPLRQMADRY